MLGEREVLAPLNAHAPGYPDEPDRNYGPSGLSVGERPLGRALGRRARGLRARARSTTSAACTLWIDWQTQQPLYFITRARRTACMLDVGILVHRFSGDLRDYPELAGRRAGAASSIPVAAVFFDVASGGCGWRRESYDVHSTPADPSELRKLPPSTTTSTHGR